MIPIGNAAAAMEPIGGEGMGLALRSGWNWPSGALYASNGSWSANDARRLQREYRCPLAMRRLGCRATAMIVSSTKAMDIALDWAGHNAGIARIAMRAMGK